ncbi:MAG: hypothetical protein HFE73_02050 [Firmicutes bacterium]|nr:hypothetical protein [Bacillota bacterium]
MTGTQFEQQTLKAGVQVYAAERFAIGKALQAHAVRLSICAPHTSERLAKGVTILADLLSHLS